MKYGWRVKLMRGLRHPSLIGIKLLIRCGGWLPDRLYLRWLYRLYMGRLLDLENPLSFNEKLQWLKLYDRRPLYSKLVDKLSVKQYVKELVGEKYVIPTLGVWNTVDQIDFAGLPDRFVLKTTHGGGGNAVIICLDKSKLDERAVRDKLSCSMKKDISAYREWPYKYVHRRIIAEQCIAEEGDEVLDYKFFCFNGTPRFLKVDFNRFVEHHANYYDLDWNLLPFGETVCPPQCGHQIFKPGNFDEMLGLVKRLSDGFPFVRVDLYNVKGAIYFGELTFYPAAGFGRFEPEEWDRKLGDLIVLPKSKRTNEE